MGLYSCSGQSPACDAGTAAAIVLEESPLSQGARRRRGVWELVKQGPRFATRTVEAKARMRFSCCTTHIH
ncbi:hypothetical protein XcmpCFBP7700_20105 [Xanthomonas campestris]|nr:hypothetical protein XcmpCFBP7700_20105 [Xanthomonas campestris]